MASTNQAINARRRAAGSLRLSRRRQWLQEAIGTTGRILLFAFASLSILAVAFIIFFIARDAIPFFRLEGVREFFTSVRWYPSAAEPEFGALSIFIGTGLVTLGAIVVAVPLGVAAAICLSDVMPFALRQVIKPVIEILAAIPSVAYGFFALVVFAPALQSRGGPMLAVAVWIVGLPLAVLVSLVAGDLATDRMTGTRRRRIGILITGALVLMAVGLLLWLGRAAYQIEVNSGTNALNVAIILGIMALPTVVSVSEDALQAVGRELREGSYAMGATRAETVAKIVLPAAGSGILAAIILGVMRAMGETMVVWMASGNSAQVPRPWFNLLTPVRTLTATIAGDMGEADHVTGSARYHVLFAMAFCLLIMALISNFASEWVMRRTRRKLGGS